MTHRSKLAIMLGALVWIIIVAAIVLFSNGTPKDTFPEGEFISTIAIVQHRDGSQEVANDRFGGLTVSVNKREFHFGNGIVFLDQNFSQENDSTWTACTSNFEGVAGTTKIVIGRHVDRNIIVVIIFPDDSRIGLGVVKR